jgi:hypothetical protein
MEASAARSGPVSVPAEMTAEGAASLAKRTVTGSGEQIVAQLLDIRERAGVPVRFVARSHFATLSYPQQVEIIDRLAAEVIPYV